MNQEQAATAAPVEKPERKKLPRGMGRTFLRGGTWWIAYWFRGREYRESSRSSRESDANKLLKKRLGEIGRGRVTGPKEERVTFDDLAAAIERDYAVNGNRPRSLESLKLSLRHLRGFFGLDRALDITPTRVSLYVEARRREGAANGSINRELAALKRMFSLALENEVLATAPGIKLLEEDNARQGFLNHGEFLNLHAALPPNLRDPVAFLYHSGWRVSEMRTLEWRDVDLVGGVITLRREVSKNRKSRTLPLRGELAEIIQRAAENRRLDCRFVFHKDGLPIGDFRKSWKTACKAANLSGIIVHDLRRTAVRNMVRAGIPEKTAMTLTGHRTRRIFDRYHIVSDSDLSEAAERLQNDLATQSAKAKVVGIEHKAA